MKKNVIVTQVVEVEVDETKFTEDFMKDYRENFYKFYTIEDHIKYLGELYSRGIIRDFSDFIESYGDLKDFGIKFEDKDFKVEIY